ncbi:MAG: hypothetical protein KGK03_01380 [Candidatus Omnitrophica bacterium]|nr:hypothetical protein [Candidatus Omnitrophota bacterium]
MLVSILMLVLYYMGAAIKRGVQSVVKVTADQVGNQQNSDQDFTNPETGYMVGSNTQMQDAHNDWNAETGYISSDGTRHFMATSGYNESTYTSTQSITNGGFTPAQ